MNKFLAAVLIASPVVAVANPLDSQKRGYVVEFHEQVVATASAPKADRRAATDPDGWSGVGAGVLRRVQELEERAQRRGRPFSARHAYSHVMNGFAAELSDDQLAALRADPLVRRITEDRSIRINAQSIPWGIGKTRATLSSTLAGDGRGSVAGVNVYIVDTGIAKHKDLIIGTSVNFAGDGRNTDCNGHGTHVAGTAGALDNISGVVGMAPGVRLNAVKVLGCDGSGMISNVIKGIDWVTANARKPAVVNMSLGGGAYQPLDDAIVRSVSTGVFYTLAAGNSAADACQTSPARVGAAVSGAMTVAASDAADAEASFSNFGPCVEVWGPGVNVLSTWTGERFATLSGTSMAAPHVAGAAALYLSRYPSATPAVLEAAIRQSAVATGRLSKNDAPVRRLDVIGF